MNNPANTVVVYPNPSNGSNAIEVSGITQTGWLSLYTITGQKVWEIQNKATGTVSIPAMYLNAGVYLLQVKYSDGSLATKKVEIVR